MRVIGVDDETLSLQGLEAKLKDVEEITEINTFLTAEDALEWLKENVVDIAFLDMDLGEITGVELAQQVKEIQPECTIIFITGYNQHTMEDIHRYALGCLLKPIRKKDLQDEILHVMKIQEFP